MLRYMILSAAMMSMAGCATITRGSNDVLVVNSTPPGAQVQLSNGETCTSTPCTFKLPRKSELNVLVSKDRCQPQQVRVTNRVAGSGSAAMAGNVLVGGIIGAGVDAGTGAMLDLVPNPVEVVLECRR
ncbi:MAG: translation initiation factor 2 [Paracoccus sp. (in: a-proteobacteria)]|uniref:translation initiation factor 2 n=1 Tax=Paracoccus sp. TaxID=267 RepID=UPI0026DF38C0|nr:translation initiation factor 2 [Paracoccus sp. (in: a-proteobacteria)]MDO5621999.1 translation initiation factor 2 [Paracoccus sp. (in: a-proteobacteria)]